MQNKYMQINPKLAKKCARAHARVCVCAEQEQQLSSSYGPGVSHAGSS